MPLKRLSAQVLAGDPIGAAQQAHEGLALVAERARLPRLTPASRWATAFPTRNRGRCDASTQVPGPDLQRLQAFYRREQHSRADRETSESPVFAGNRVCWAQLRVKWESPGSNYLSFGQLS